MDNEDQCDALVKMLVGSIDYSTKEFDLSNAQVVGSLEIVKQMFLNQLLWGAATADELPDEEDDEEYEEEDEGEEWKH
jgi:hypothetical protein